MAISPCPFSAEAMAVLISGKDVPIAITVNPIIISGTPKIFATHNPDHIISLLEIITPTIPIMKKNRILFNLGSEEPYFLTSCLRFDVSLLIR